MVVVMMVMSVYVAVPVVVFFMVPVMRMSVVPYMHNMRIVRGSVDTVGLLYMHCMTGCMVGEN